jgi:hypothetical protein
VAIDLSIDGMDIVLESRLASAKVIRFGNDCLLAEDVVLDTNLDCSYPRVWQGYVQHLCQPLRYTK